MLAAMTREDAGDALLDAGYQPLDAGYELLDAGDGRRLERLGGRVVDRPAPTAEASRRDFLAWRASDLRFDSGRGWSAAGSPVEATGIEPWAVVVDGLSMEVRPTASGGLGLYPEHAANIDWLARRIAERGLGGVGSARGGSAPSVLNLFAHTGLLTLAAARAGAAVTHVDASRAAVAWARRNAELSGLADRPVRWIVDDAMAFVAREARRGRRYDGIVLDPPSFGRAGRRQWRLLDELPSLLAACAEVAGVDAFLLLTTHTTGLAGDGLARVIEAALDRGPRTVAPLILRATSGADLPLGWYARVE
jgi:23S rRNA (cytosine1962-C5)-methyltransferase